MAENVSDLFEEFPPLFENLATYKSYLSLQRAQTQLLPAVCLVGVLANILSLVVFLQPSLRRLSCSVYLAAKSLSDLLFLATVFIIWLVRVDIKVFYVTGICQIVVFLSYLTAFVSIWLAVVLTVENLLCVWKPWFVQRTCNSTVASALTLIILVLGVSLYQFSLWSSGVSYQSGTLQLPTPVSSGATPAVISHHKTSNVTHYHDQVSESLSADNSLHVDFHDPSASLDVHHDDAHQNVSSDVSDDGGEKVCVMLEEYKHFMVITSYIDSVITIFIPIIILAFTNAAIAFIAVRSSRRSRAMRKDKPLFQNSSGRDNPPKRNASAAVSLEKQASKFLFLVSVTLLVFHFPVHIVRLKMIVFSPSVQDIFLQRIFETLYYTHYAISFFVYLIYGSNFRKVFINIVTRKK